MSFSVASYLICHSHKLVEVILAAPGKLPKEERLYLQKKDFGRVPAYLQRNKQLIATEQQMLEEFVKLRTQPVRCPVVDVR